MDFQKLLLCSYSREFNLLIFQPFCFMHFPNVLNRKLVLVSLGPANVQDRGPLEPCSDIPLLFVEMPPLVSLSGRFLLCIQVLETLPVCLRALPGEAGLDAPAACSQHTACRHTLDKTFSLPLCLLHD